MISKRDINLLNLILESRNGIHGKELSKKLNITDRTVRNDINRINNELYAEKIKISSNKTDGYYLLDNDYYALLNYMDNNFGDKTMQVDNSHYIPTDSDERIIYLTLQLAFNCNYTNMDALADSTFSSKTSIRNDLLELKKEVEKIGFLELETNQTKGTILKGLESSKRILISKMLYHHIDHYYAYIKSLLNVFLNNTNKFYELYDLFTSFFDENNIIFTDRSIRLFTFETLLFSERFRNGMKLENTYSFNNETSLELPYKKINQILSCDLDEKERMYLLDSLSFKRILYNGGNYFEDPNAENVVNEFFSNIKTYYHINISTTPEMEKNFKLHISSLIQRIKHHTANNQDFIKDIKSAYPYSFELSTSIIPIIWKYYSVKIDESELSYIAIHLSVFLNETNDKIKTVIICANGLSESQLIELKVNSRFKDSIEIVESCSFYMVDKVLENNKSIKLILTTLPFVSPIDGVEILQINPCFTSSDIYNCEKTVLKLQSKTSELTALYECFNYHFFNIYDRKDPSEVLDEMIENLYRHKIILDKTAFFESIKQRESFFPTIYDNIWIPHPLDTMATKTIFSVSLIKNSTNINLIILCAVKDGDTIKYKDIFNHITNLLSNEKLTQKISEINNFSEFLEFFKNI